MKPSITHTSDDQGLVGPRNFAEQIRVFKLALLRQEANHLGLIAWKFNRNNLLSKEPVIGDGRAVVSLTTYGQRLKTVHLTVESIAAGTIRPSRLILWLDDEDQFINRPVSIRRLEDRGLEVRLTTNYGPHTKYYPYLLSVSDFILPLITADDDVMYTRWWLKSLVEGFEEHQTVLNCFRAHRLNVAHGELSPYRTWAKCLSKKPSSHNFVTGVSGCIYPPAFLHHLKKADLGFKSVCPKADDIWLNVNALRHGFKVRQLQAYPLRFPLVAGTQDTGLWNGNVILDQNDEQIHQTYLPGDLALLRSAGD